MKIVYTSGVFDIIHPGHIYLLETARACGDHLIVGVQEDESVLRQKGRKPIIGCEYRMKILSALSFVDGVLSYSDLDQRPILKLVKPDVVVQGYDWLETSDRSIILEYLKKNNIVLKIVDKIPNISSSLIKKRIVDTFSETKNDA